MTWGHYDREGSSTRCNNTLLSVDYQWLVTYSRTNNGWTATARNVSPTERSMRNINFLSFVDAVRCENCCKTGEPLSRLRDQQTMGSRSSKNKASSSTSSSIISFDKNDDHTTMATFLPNSIRPVSSRDCSVLPTRLFVIVVVVVVVFFLSLVDQNVRDRTGGPFWLGGLARGTWAGYSFWLLTGFQRDLISKWYHNYQVDEIKRKKPMHQGTLKMMMLLKSQKRLTGCVKLESIIFLDLITERIIIV